MNKNELRIRFTTTLSLAVYVMLLSACSKAPEPVPADEPVIAGNHTVRPAAGGGSFHVVSDRAGYHIPTDRYLPTACHRYNAAGSGRGRQGGRFHDGNIG